MPVTGARRAAAPLAVVALLVAPALPGAMGGAALGHAQLVASTPGAGEIVAEQPAELRLVFSEPLESEVTSLDLVGPDGASVLSRAGAVATDDRFVLVAPLPALADGAYTVRWRTLSSADGHIVEGSFSFGVGDPDAVGTLGGSHEEAADRTPANVVGRMAIYLGFMLAVGVAVFHAVAVRSGPMPLSLARVLAAGLGLAAAASLAVPFVDAVEAGGTLGSVVTTRNGQLSLARGAIATVGALGLLVGGARWRWLVAAAAGIAGLALHVAAGHAAAIASPLGIAGQVVHVGAASVWVGGIVGLVVATQAPRMLVETGPPPSLRDLVPRFSALALVGIGLVALSGLLAAWSLTGVVIDPATTYGRTLLLKLAVVAAALGLGAVNFIDGGGGRRWIVGLPGRLRLEAGLAVVVLLVTALLSTTTPTDEARGVAVEPVPDAFGQVIPGVAMEIVPGRAGVNRFLVETTDAVGSASLQLVLELNRLDAATTTRIPLAHAVGDHGSGGSARWAADAQTLPPGSAWDASVLVMSDTGAVLSRQRFAFALDDAGVNDGQVVNLVDPGTVVAVLLVVAGMLGLGLGLGGGRIPRTDAAASRIALLVGGAVAALLGLGIGVEALLRLVR
jgi:copper transport protein